MHENPALTNVQRLFEDVSDTNWYFPRLSSVIYEIVPSISSILQNGQVVNIVKCL